MKICNRCWKTYNDEEAYDRDYIYDDTPIGRVAIARTADLIDCECGGELEEAKQCAICGYWIAEDGPSVCEECFDNGATFENALEFGSINTVDVELNSFLATLGSEKINAILTAYVKSGLVDAEAMTEKYVKREGCFGDFLADKAEDARVAV